MVSCYCELINAETLQNNGIEGGGGESKGHVKGVMPTVCHNFKGNLVQHFSTLTQGYCNQLDLHNGQQLQIIC